LNFTVYAKNANILSQAMGKRAIKIIGALVAPAMIACGLIALAQITGCRSKSTESAKIKVVATLFPLYDMARNIGGEKADVSLLMPPGVEPHTFEPTPSDIIKINEADIFVYTDRFMEPWAADMIKGVVNKKLIVVDASKGTQMISAEFHDRDEPQGARDPHIWLDFDNARIMARNIAGALEAKDPADKAFFQQRAADYDKKLSELDTSFRKTLGTCRHKEIVYAGHYAFGYLAKRYGLKYLAAQGVSPNAEPTAKDLTNLVEQIRKNNIHYVFYEELTSPKIAETIAGETDASLLLLNPAANLTKDQFERGVSFFDIMNADLKNLEIGLECG
jgi:zinc transport system substrate-binding protein